MQRYRCALYTWDMDKTTHAKHEDGSTICGQNANEVAITYTLDHADCPTCTSRAFWSQTRGADAATRREVATSY